MRIASFWIVGSALKEAHSLLILILLIYYAGARVVLARWYILFALHDPCIMMMHQAAALLV